MIFDQPVVVYLLTAALSYLSGSIPFGLLLTKIAGKGDVRDIGSGNIGATNVLRTGSKVLAAGTLLCDLLKGFLPVLIAYKFGVGAAIIAAVAALIGHMYPIWLRFKGGKGVATFIGTLLGLSWPLALGFCAVWLAMALVFRISSLSALVATLLTPFGAMVFAPRAMVVALALMSALVIYRHRENIQRLLRGEESKIRLKR